jgi:hypothetical protein
MQPEEIVPILRDEPRPGERGDDRRERQMRVIDGSACREAAEDRCAKVPLVHAAPEDVQARAERMPLDPDQGPDPHRDLFGDAL